MIDCCWAKDGTPIPLDTYLELRADRSYCVIASDHAGGYRVSTVWIGLDLGFDAEGAPLIFETMLFADGDREDPRFDRHDETYRYDGGRGAGVASAVARRARAGS